MKNIRQSLAVFGCITAFTGILTLVLFGTSALSRESLYQAPSTEEADYVGSGGCLTCHSDDEGNWTDTPKRTILGEPVSNPHAVSLATDALISSIPDEMPALPPDVFSLAEDGAHKDASDGGGQGYMILTDAGYFLLPDDWTTADHPVIRGKTVPPAPDECIDCHRSRPKLSKDGFAILFTNLSGIED